MRKSPTHACPADQVIGSFLEELSRICRENNGVFRLDAGTSGGNIAAA
jgi:hypothetical protein